MVSGSASRRLGWAGIVPSSLMSGIGGTDHQIGANIDHLERATGVVIDPGVSS